MTKQELNILVAENVEIYQEGITAGIENKRFKNPFTDKEKRLVWEIGNEDGKQYKDLDGHTPQYGYALGLEFNKILNIVDSKCVENLAIHTTNLGKTKLVCRLFDRDLKYKILNDDVASITIQ